MMGIYICDSDEIYDKLEEALDNLQGEVYADDFKLASQKILLKYEHFTSKVKEVMGKKPNLKIGEEVVVWYEYQLGLRHVKKRLEGTVQRIYPTVFGGTIRDWGVSVKLHKPHPVNTKRTKSTFRANKVHKVRCG